jgi:molybdopterin-guanine dinucleotide biosynthesis protein A
MNENTSTSVGSIAAQLLNGKAIKQAEDGLQRSVAGYVLAGGQSSRMGTDKALLEIDGTPLLLRAANTLAAVASPVVVVGHPDRHSGLGVDVIDVLEDSVSGPNLDYMDGIVKALQHSSAEWTMVISADMPYLTTAWLRYLLARALDADVDLVAKGFCHVYRTSCLPKILRALDEFYPAKYGKTMRYLSYVIPEPEEYKAFDPEGWLFLDVDTPEEFELARQRLGNAKS